MQVTAGDRPDVNVELLRIAFRSLQARANLVDMAQNSHVLCPPQSIGEDATVVDRGPAMHRGIWVRSGFSRYELVMSY